ncbi:hypothetical protein CHISP_2159 [Chitinispirillum alkaliphilum]|nr:hypothetical protein CHISP_2159 [Chitinispirillum alkaliphilum]
MYSAEYFISKLNLEEHIEGGYFKEVYRSSCRFAGKESVSESERSLSTSIYFLLKGNQVSRFHSLRSDELWYYHYGSSVIIHMISKDGVLESRKLGLNMEKDERPQILIPAGVVFAAENRDKEMFSLVSCVVSPGFDFRDFKLHGRDELIASYPSHSDLIERFTREGS